MSNPFRTATDVLGIDIGLLHYRDRAVLRILDRAEVATPRQLAILAYGHRRVAQRRLLRLWHAGLLERAIVPHAQRGGAEIAYRLSDRARRRLGDTATRSRGVNRLGHALDVVETICALVTANGDPRTCSPVRLWLDEPNAAAILGTPPFPDAVVVLERTNRTGVVCLEIDEATQRRAVIEAKLNGYRTLLEANPTWVVLFVVPSPRRARWLRVVSGDVDRRLASRSWVTTLGSLGTRKLTAEVESLAASGPMALERLLADPVRAFAEAPVATEAWLKLLGEGGLEAWDGSGGNPGARQLTKLAIGRGPTAGP
ncbi:MAG: replication-relaxation family protein [Chloroflexota bacterium]